MKVQYTNDEQTINNKNIHKTKKIKSKLVITRTKLKE